MANPTSTLNSALVAALGELRNVPKDKVNPHFKSRFTSLDAILDATRPVLAKHGLALSQEPVFEDGMAGVITRIIHTGGETRESKLLLPLRDQSAQGAGGCITYARRYSAAAVLGITSDEDLDGNEIAPSRPVNKPVIAKPVIAKPAQTIDPAPVPAPSKTLHNDDLTGRLFAMMDENKVTEDEVIAFCKHKGMKAVPDYVADLSIPTIKVNSIIFSEVIEFTLSK